jgi:hypothetical protein
MNGDGAMRDDGRNAEGADGPSGRRPGARPHDDPQVQVRVFLIRRRCPARVVADGLEGLIADWEKIAGAVADGYPLDTLEDYLNDMDVRNLIHDAVGQVPAALDAGRRARLEAADRRIRTLLVPAAECLWGAEQARREGWSAQERWWYFMRPARPGPGLGGELGA